jgi:hypothetical protein
MRRMMPLKITLVIWATIGLLMPVSATADTTSKRCGKTGKCYVIAKRDGVLPNRDRTAIGQDSKVEHQDANTDRRVSDASKKFSAVLAAYDRRVAAYTRCIQTPNTSSNIAGCGTPPTAPQFRSDTFSGRGNQPRITAGQAAAIAVARLKLPTVAPGIGPSPKLNPWNMAAVGYPLWLWADGPTHVGPISDSVAGLSVSLEAEVSSLTFRMGDGHTVNCAGTGHPWTTAVEPGTKSPNCGYSYTRPSLPDHNYTVAARANWAVTWTSNGQSGVINVPVVDTTELPVGELQVLVR